MAKNLKNKILTSFVEGAEIYLFLCYDRSGDEKMKNEILIQDVIKAVDKVILELDTKLFLKDK